MAVENLIAEGSKFGWPWTPAPGLRFCQSADGKLPRISIVTPSYNQGAFIEETIRSVLLQDYPNLEYFVMDGGSTDNTTEVIRRYADRITHYESEKDRGQSHAINKGLAHSTGDIFNWINSDDLLLPGALWRVAESWLGSSGNIISGDTEFFDGSGTFSIMRARNQSLQNFVRFWECDYLGWAQQATFLPLANVKALGGVREVLKYCMDYHLMVRLLASGLNVTYLDQALARFRHHPASKTVGATHDFRLERVPTLQAMKDLPVSVTEAEWNEQQARRLFDVARRSWKSGSHTQSLRLLGRAIMTSPEGFFSEIGSRIRQKCRRQPRDSQQDLL
jgi:hypothetical protein